MMIQKILKKKMKKKISTYTNMFNISFQKIQNLFVKALVYEMREVEIIFWRNQLYATYVVNRA